MKKLMVLVSVMCFVIFGIYASDKKEKDKGNAFELVDGKTLIFEARSLTSRRGFNKSLSSNYHLIIQGDSASAYLPYMGRAYSGAYGGDGPIAFDNDMLEYKVDFKKAKKAKNNRMQLSFKVKSDKDIFECTLSIWENGNASLFLSPGNRQSVSFDGTVEPIENEK